MNARLRRLGYRHWTARVRLTVLHGGLFLVAGLAVLAVVYVLMARALRWAPVKLVLIEPQTGDPVAVKQAAAEQYLFAQQQADAFRVYVLHQLLKMGGAALGLMAVLAIAAGWVTAGRVLRPLSTITATARRVAASSLHERIRPSGPRDEIRELAETFDAMLERLDTAFDGQQAFIGNASHELKTPLAINRTLIEVAMGRPDAPPELLHLGQTLLAVNARHERMIDGLLTLARSGQRLTVHTPVDLAQVVQVTAGHVERRDRRLHTDLYPAPVLGDRVLLERLALNLVENALRYNLPEGSVWISTGVRRGAAVLTVVNTGPVLAAHEVPTLFEPFHRLGADRTGSAHGTGLGLSIVRSVARAHGGDVTATPRAAGQDGGLQVTVRLPVG